MAELPPLTERELRFVRALISHEVRFLIVGLSAAALQGAPVVTQDVDLWFGSLDDPGLTAALRQVGGAYVAPTLHSPPMLAGEGLELFDVETKVLPLTRILASKRAADRPKDRLVVPVLEEVVALQAARSRDGR